MGFTDRKDRFPARGERIARWVERYMQEQGLTISELAFRVKADKRDIRRLLVDRSCGPRLNDDLEVAFEWDFIEEVATPVVGADPITARERALEQRLTQAAALHARIERDRASRPSTGPEVVGMEGATALFGARARREGRAKDQSPPQGADA